MRKAQGWIAPARVSVSLLILLAQAPGSLADDPVTEEWVVRYDGRRSRNEVSRAMSSDSAGYIYLTGYSYGGPTDYEIVTVKYDGTGNLMWEARYDGPDGLYHIPKALAVDSSGNVLVAGDRSGGATYDDMLTIKYDAGGNLLWMNSYDGTGSRYDMVEGMAVDASGNVYLTGSSFGGEDPEMDIVTIKYDGAGSRQWVARYDGPDNLNDSPEAIALDLSGNVIVAGGSRGTETETDMVVLKYDPDGRLLWTARYDGPNSWSDGISALAVDGSGNVYVAGLSPAPEGNMVTIKYDPDGNYLWEARYNRSGSFNHYAKALAVDPSGGVHVVGSNFTPGTQEDIITAKYDSEGNLLWVNTYNGQGNDYDTPEAIALDPLGNVYVTGYGYGDGTNLDMITIKYGADGSLRWETRYNGRADSDDIAIALVVDPDGDVLVSGSSVGPGTGYDFLTIKYLQSAPMDTESEPIVDHRDGACFIASLVE